MEERKRTRLLIVAALILALVQLGSAYYWFVATDRIDGYVNEKFIMGHKDDVSYTLVGFWGDGQITVDPAVSDLFVGQDINMTVPAGLDEALRSRGYELYYYGQIGLHSPDHVNGLEAGQGTSYFASREDFNLLKVGNYVTLDIAHDQRTTIREVNR